jgi:hypothetical protein
MPSRTCGTCGSPYVGFVCDHCGALASAPTSPEQERQALDEYRALVARSERQQQVQLLKSGFLPDDSAQLINAGLHCVSLIDSNEVIASRSDAAVGRLEAVAIKLDLLPQDGEIRRANAAFRAKIGDYRAKARRDTFLGLALMAIVATGIGYLVFG